MMKPGLLFYATPCMCFGPTILARGEACCVCSDDERLLRARAEGVLTTPLTTTERRWCVDEAVWFGEGTYQRDDVACLTDTALCAAVLDAWRQYVQTHY